MAVLLALLLLFAIGTIVGDRPAIWAVALLGSLMVALTVLGAGVFALDALEVRSQVRRAMESRYNIASAWALAKMCFAGFGAIVLSVSAFRSARSMGRSAAAGTGKRQSSVLLNSWSTPPTPPPPPTSKTPAGSQSST
jgi:hypothetical protein